MDKIADRDPQLTGIVALWAGKAQLHGTESIWFTKLSRRGKEEVVPECLDL